MQPLGVVQFHQKKFQFLDLKDSPFEGLLGDVPRFFIAVVYGYSGNGKTELCIQWAKYFCNHGKVGWLSYEQRHGADLQKATIRNKMNEVSGSFILVDPLAKRTKGLSLLQELDLYLSKRNTPEFIFIDSLDYMRIRYADYEYLRDKYYGKKAIIFLAHAKRDGTPKKAITDDIIFDGGFGIQVKKYIAFPEKNRYGGMEPYVIYPERAEELNPAFFAKRAAASKRAKKKKNKSETKEIEE